MIYNYTNYNDTISLCSLAHTYQHLLYQPYTQYAPG